MSTDAVADEADDAGDDRHGAPPNGPPTASKQSGGGGGFFSIYKKGQGYWTRMGTVIACAVLGLMLAYTLYDKVPSFFVERHAGAVTAPTTTPEAQALIEKAKTDLAAGHNAAGRAQLDAVINAPKTSGITAEVVEQARAIRNDIPRAEEKGKRYGIIASLAFLAIYVPIVARLVNKPSNVDFLIATDSEMKKVNWTSRRELIGSTKVVIVFMFFIAILLFVIDIVFGYLMHWIGVLIHSPYITIGGG